MVEIFTPEDVVKSVQGGITTLKGLKLDDSDALGTIKYSEAAGPVTLTIGASPDIKFKSVESKKTYSDKVEYTARMAIMDFQVKSEEKSVCLESVGFTSPVTPNATFQMTYQLVAYCKMAKVDNKKECFNLDKGEKITFILPTFLDCKDKDATKLAQCYCKALKNDNKPDVSIMDVSGSQSASKSSVNSNGASQTLSGSENSASNSASNSKVNGTSNANLVQPHNMLSCFLIFFLLYTFLFKRH